MTDLIAFLSARLDEARAKAASSDPVGAMEAHFESEALREEQDWKSFPDRDTPYSHGQADAMRWASGAIRERMIPLSLHDPHRVLREVEADRKLIALHAVEVRREERRAGYDEIAEGKPPVYWVDEYSCVICGWFDAEQGACETVRIRAERFSDHPDYRDEWKPAA